MVSIILYPFKGFGLLIMILFVPLIILLEDRSMIRPWLKELGQIIKKQLMWMTILMIIIYLFPLIGGNNESLWLCLIGFVSIGTIITIIVKKNNLSRK